MGTVIKHLVPDRVKPSFVIFDISPEHQSAWMSKITNDGLTWSGTGCFIAVPIWQQWASKGETYVLFITWNINALLFSAVVRLIFFFSRTLNGNGTV